MSLYLEQLRQIKLGIAPKTTGLKPKQPIKKISNKKAAELIEAAKEGDTELKKWYAAIMKKEIAKCWETGQIIDKKDVKGWHGSIAHVLPKSLFPSVATHPKNYMILKMWGGTHGQYDSSWENAAQMKVWPRACEIINLLYPLLTTEEKRRLLQVEVISQELNPEML